MIDTLPGSVGFVSAVPDQGSCAQAAGVITCNLGSVPVGSTNIVIVVTSTVAGTVTNTAGVTTSTDDPAAANDTATENTTVESPENPPVANNDTAATPEDTQVVIDVTANDTDPDADLDPTSVTITAAPTNGTATVDPTTGQITYTPNPDYHGPDSLTYQICDLTSPTPLCDTATVTITVNPDPDPPVFTGSTTVVVTVADAPGTLSLTDPDGDNFTVFVLNGPLPSGLGLEEDGSWTGETRAAGSYPVTLRVCDDHDPAACTDFTLLLQVTLLPVTGINSGRMALAGLLTLIVGGLLRQISRRQDAIALSGGDPGS